MSTEREFVKVCTCGAAIVRELWEELPELAQIESEDDEGAPCTVSLRNCPECGSTLALPLAQSAAVGVVGVS
jgi:hypothetical protein